MARFSKSHRKVLDRNLRNHPSRNNLGSLGVKLLNCLFPSIRRSLLNLLVAGATSILLWLLVFSGPTSDGGTRTSPFSQTVRPSSQHPIPGLIQDGLAKWEKMLSSQSKTYDEAVANYKRRYKLDPPAGFDKWYSYCFSNNVLLVDEYDELMRSLEPFRKMGSREMRRRAAASMWAFYDTNAIVVNKEGLSLAGHEEIRVERAEGIVRYLRDNKVVEILKGVVTEEWMIPTNELAEPRVLDKVDLTGLKFQPKNKNGGTVMSKIWESHQFGEGSLIESIKKACGGSSPFSTGQQKPNWTPDKEIPTTSYAKAFVKNVWDDLNVCQHPDMPKHHSFFRTRHTTTRGLIPMLGFGRPSVFGEILVPTHYWWGNPDYTIDPKKDIPWENKTSTLYWHGSSTGGGKGDPTLGSMHRHRLVRFFSQPTSPARSLQNTTHFTFVLPSTDDCWNFDCPTIKSFPTAPHTPLNDHTWSNKFLADLDGWGYSARFRALMKSNSAVIKSTAMVEWWSDRIVPWVHYIPASVSGDDWGDLISFFVGLPDNTTKPDWSLQDKLAREIAERGREWAYKNTRSQDMTAYTLRVFLELNRLFTANYLPGDKALDEKEIKAERAEEAKIRKEVEEQVTVSVKTEHEGLLDKIKDKVSGTGEEEIRKGGSQEGEGVYTQPQEEEGGGEEEEGDCGVR
ncbi:hypothetical protein BJ508DRAFT_1062 [Ascobolus immersus RN42]|uniref:Glycosyl transferase CAP10 domain-containing protein n=1 Tax=Ascobolus immersus RN42 TaxID=1160509 RepID=A0A3N4IUP7_ASCIM|nr:hypothetical protein BJ508DRAFT_1062 [Ascobolus immersus RN42]